MVLIVGARCFAPDIGHVQRAPTRQGPQKLRSEAPEGARPSGTATTKLKRNAADGLFTKPSRFSGCRLGHFQTIVRAKGNTLAAVDAHKGLPGNIQKDRIHRAGPSAFPAPDAETFSHDDATAFSLRVGARRARPHTGSRIAGQAVP